MLNVVRCFPLAVVSVVIKAMHTYFISFIKENKLTINSSSGDECTAAHILCVSVRDFCDILFTDR